jgi:hypothetical protein
MKGLVCVFLIPICFLFQFSFAQNVAINSDGSPPDSSALLDLSADHLGVLIPRVELSGSWDTLTVNGPATSLLVFNTITLNDVTPGYYYWNGEAWSRLSTMWKRGSPDIYYNEGNVGIGIDTPSHLLEVIGNSGTDFKPIAYFENTVDSLNGQLADGIGVMGVSDTHDHAGYGVYGKGGLVGVRGRVDAQDSSTYYGVAGRAQGGSGENVGVWGSAQGAGNNYGVGGFARGGETNYGIYGSADTSGKAGTYAGYFEGDVHIRNRLGVGTETPAYQMEVVGDSKAAHTPIAFFQNWCDTVEGNLVDAYGIQAICDNVDWAGYGGLFKGGYIGVKGEVNPTDTFNYLGVFGTVSGGAGVNSGVYGHADGDGVNRAVRGYASGTSENYAVAGLARNGLINYAVLGRVDTSGVEGTYAGYFLGDTYISSRLGIGTETPDYKLQVDGDIVPEADNVYNIGSNTLGWDTLFMSSTIDYKNDLSFTNLGSEYLKLTTDGKVGVGTSSPNGDFQINDHLVFQRSSTGLDYNIANNIYYNNGWKYIASNYGSVLSLDDNGALGFGTTPQGTAGGAATVTNRFYIRQNGDIGIGTTNPDAKLEVVGTVQAEGIKIPTGATSGHVLTSDANGNATWQSPVQLGVVPIGTILPWSKNMSGVPSLPSEFVECNGQSISDPSSPLNGQNTPDLNSAQRFLMGAATSGSTGGTTTHDHSGTTSNNTQTEISTGGVPSGSVTKIDHNHTYTTSSENHLPPFYTVVWIMRVK